MRAMDALTLFNIATSAAISLAVIGFVYALWNYSLTQSQREKIKPSIQSMTIFWTLVAAFHILAAIDLFIIESGASSNTVTVLTFIPLAFLAAPITYLVLYLLTGNKSLCWAVSIIFIIIGGLYIGIKFKAISEIGGSYALGIFLILLFIVPTAMIAGILVIMALRRVPKAPLYKIALSLVAMSFAYDFIVYGLMNPLNDAKAASNIFVFVALVLGFLAYFPPQQLQESLGIEEIEFEPYEGEDNGWEE